MLCRPDGFMLYGKKGVDFFSTSELLLPYMKNRLGTIQARHTFYKISDNPNFSLGSVFCSLYSLRIALKDDYHKKRCLQIRRVVQLPGNSNKNFHHSCRMNSVHARKLFQRCSSSSACQCFE